MYNRDPLFTVMAAKEVINHGLKITYTSWSRLWRSRKIVSCFASPTIFFTFSPAIVKKNRLSLEEAFVMH